MRKIFGATPTFMIVPLNIIIIYLNQQTKKKDTITVRFRDFILIDSYIMTLYMPEDSFYLPSYWDSIMLLLLLLQYSLVNRADIACKQEELTEYKDI